MGFFDGLTAAFHCDVKIALKYGSFFPGNLVEGVVILTVSKPVPAVAVRVKIAGKERVVVRRQEGYDDNNNAIKRTYTQTSKVLKQLITLVGHTKCSGNRSSTTIHPGTYTYPFAFQLPTVLPPSFHLAVSDDYASIMYYVKAYVDIPNGRDAKSKHHFQLLTGIPRRQWQSADPVAVDRNYDVSCCCFSKGKVNCRFWMDRTCISIDRDNLLVTADIDNTQGEEPVQSVEFSLFNLLTYTAQCHTDTNRRRVGHAFITQRVEPGQRGRVQGVITLDRTLVPSLTCFHTKSHYLVRLELNIPNAFDPCHEFPVVVAHCVDDSDRLPPIFPGSCQYPMVQETEFVYTPPPNPVYGYSPFAAQMPSGGPAYQWAPPAFPFIPPQSQHWGAPVGFENTHVAAGIGFGTGCAMQELPPPLGVPCGVPCSPPPPQPGMGGCAQPYGSPTGPYNASQGASNEPLQSPLLAQQAQSPNYGAPQQPY